MKWIRLTAPLLSVFLLQFYLSEFLSIRTIRPDFLIIFIIYFSIKYGRFYGVLAGFTLGLLIDLTPVASYFGLSALTYSFTGYLAGYLKGKYSHWNPLYFHLAWIGILAFHFFLFSYVRYQFLFETNGPLFWKKWSLTTSYTLGFFLAAQFVFPLKDVE